MHVKRINDVTISEIKEILLQGGTVVYPTDTVYGLFANPFNETAVSRIFLIKVRSKMKPLPLFVDSITRAHSLAFINKKTEMRLNAIWPGKVTVVLPKRSTVPSIITGGKPTVGLRIPARDDIRTIISELNFPLIATSANISGKEPTRSVEEVIAQFSYHHPQPNLIVDAGELVYSSSSTVLDLTKDQPRILRAGLLTKNQFSTLFQSED